MQLFQPHVPLFVYKSPYVSKKSDWNYCNYRNSLWKNPPIATTSKISVSAQVSTSRNNCNYYNQTSECFHLKHSNQF